MPRIGDPAAESSPAPTRPRTRRIARPVLLAMLAVGALGAIAATFSRHAAFAPSTLTVVFEHEGSPLEPPGWRTDGRLRRTAESGARTFDRWTLAGPPDVSYDGMRVLFAGRTAAAVNATLWEMAADGRGARQIENCALGCAAPRYLPDGRIVFAAPVGADHVSEALFVSRRDGSAPDRITYGRGRDRAVGVLPDGRIVFARRPIGPSGEAGDTPLLLTVQPDGTGFARASLPLPAGLAIAEAAWVHRPPAQTASGRTDAVLASRRADGGAPPAIVVDLAPRPVPAIATSVVDAARQTGRLLCLDAWLTTRDGRPFRREERSGRIRILDSESDAVLGEAPIAEDGSFYVEVPANRVLRLQALDSAGAVVSTLDSGLWVRPNENRGCIGCHEPPTLAPANRFPLALHAEPVAALGRDTEAAAMRAETPR